MAPRQHQVDDDRERVDVVGGQRHLTLQHLEARECRRQRRELRRIEHRVVAVVVVHTNRARDAEVENFRSAVAGDENVARLEVRVGNAAVVRALQPCAHPLDQRPQNRVRQPVRIFLQQPRELLPLQQLHRHVRDVAILVEVEDRDDVRVRDSLRLRRLALQRDERIGMRSEVVVQYLDCDVGVAVLRFDFAQILRAIHGSHAAGTEFLVEDEALLQDARCCRRLSGTRSAVTAQHCDVVSGGIGDVGLFLGHRHLQRSRRDTTTDTLSRAPCARHSRIRPTALSLTLSASSRSRICWCWSSR